MVDASLVFANTVRAEEGNISQKVYLGSRKVAESATALQQIGITAVVNSASSQISKAKVTQDDEDYPYLALDLYDNPKYEKGEWMFDPRIRDAFDKTIQFIDGVFSSGKNEAILVHCAGGISRSASLVLSWLVASQGMSLRAAWLHVVEARPIVGPNAVSFLKLM